MIGGGYNPWFIDEVKRRTAALRQERLESVGAGACGDFADYRYAVGFFEGLDRVIEIIDTIKKEQDQA